MFSMFFKKRDKRTLNQLEHARKVQNKEIVYIKASDSELYSNEDYRQVVLKWFEENGYKPIVDNDILRCCYYTVCRKTKKFVCNRSLCGWPTSSIDVVELAKLDHQQYMIDYYKSRH